MSSSCALERYGCYMIQELGSIKRRCQICSHYHNTAKMYTIRFILIVLVALTNGASIKSKSLCSTAVCGSCAKIVMMRAGSYRVIKTCQKVLNMNGCCNSRSIRAALHFWIHTLYTAYLNKLSIINTLTEGVKMAIICISLASPGKKSGCWNSFHISLIWCQFFLVVKQPQTGKFSRSVYFIRTLFLGRTKSSFLR